MFNSSADTFINWSFSYGHFLMVIFIKWSFYQMGIFGEANSLRNNGFMK